MYYETVFDEQCSSFKEIENLWRVVPENQKDIEYRYDIIAENDELCIINFKMKRKLVPSGVVQEINGVFQISLNGEGKCNYFKQWRSVKEN